MVAHQTAAPALEGEDVTVPERRLVQAASVAEVEAAGMKPVNVGGSVVLLIAHEGTIQAIDNRCPHKGFPLARGTLRDGILTCHWHHARFEICSGGTFDPFADDVRTYPLEIKGEEIWVDPTPERDEVAHQRRRLQDGLKHNLRLVMAKATIGLMAEGEEPAGLLEIGGRFGATQRDAGWRDGLTILTAMANILPHLAADDRPLALFHGMLHVASSVQGQRPHFDVGPLPGGETDPERLKAWLREFAEVRDRDGVERVVLSSLQANHDAKGLADMLFSAVTDHYFIGGGHSIDFVNKAFELLDVIGWQHSPEILVSVIPGITAGTRMEETSTWRTPVDLVGLLEPVFSDLLAGKFGDGHSDERLTDADFDALIARLMGDDPTAIIRALADLLVAGVALTELSLALSFAAALRVARFHLSNEFNDWVAVLHTFTSANATHRLLKRAPSLEGARAIWHSAMDLYLHRFLNAPAARQPSDTCVAGLPTGGDELLAHLLELTDGRQRVEEAAATTYRYLLGGYDDAPLLATLGKTLLREDGEFHSYQMLEAGLGLYLELRDRRPDLAPTVLVAVARYLAGHAPTDRATTQTYRVAARLQAGGALMAD